jgi:hypothetical protein
MDPCTMIVRPRCSRASRPWTRWGVMVVCLTGLAACSQDFFGPDTETRLAVRSGTVTSGLDGSPIEGARVFWSHQGVVGSGPVLVPDTAVSDAAGFYRLETEHYCNSQLSAKADGYATVRTNLSYLACPETQSQMVDIILQPN